ncbi:unnamed protein product, partial [Pylaiella littoralis]
ECQLTKATATKFGRDRGIAKVKEPWAKRALSYMWGLREATVELEASRELKNTARAEAKSNQPLLASNEEESG